MRPFVFEAHVPRTVFGPGSIERIPDEVERLGVQRVLIVTESTARQLDLAKQITASLSPKAAGTCADAVMHTPSQVTEKAMRQAKALDADCLLSIGGGSTVGLGKALAIRLLIPHIAVPTTYAGSEATPILGETLDGLTYTSGINAIAHCVEAMYSSTSNPLIDNLALGGIRALKTALTTLKRSPNDVDARGEAVFGAWSAGICLGHVGMGLHHKLCHTLGGSFNLPHAEVHTVILPHAMAYNTSAAMNVMEQIRGALQTEQSAAKAVWALERTLGTVMSLKDLGMKEEDLERAADIASQSQYPNPAPIERPKVLQLLRNAYHGQCPE